MDTFEGSSNDPLSLHKYLYAGADPVNGIDPSGNDFDLGSTVAALGANQTIQSIATLAVRGAILGGVFGATDASLQGKSGSEIFSEALHSGLIGAAIGPLIEIKFIAPVIIALGTVGGVEGVVDAIEQKNYALAAFRGLATYVGFRTFVEEANPSLPGPLPPTGSGGRLGSNSTRVQLFEIAQYLRSKGWTITGGGGGAAPEEYLPPSGGGRSGGNYVDLTATKNGTTLRINTVSTLSDGVTPTADEAAAAALIRSKIGTNEQLILIPKNQ